MDIEKFKERLTTSGDGKWLVFEAEPEEITRIQNKTSYGNWERMRYDAFNSGVERAVVALNGVVIAEMSPGSFEKFQRQNAVKLFAALL